ncbi:MAG: hypothetical protein ACFFDI_29230 [Promethearchaeota archaeon]
MTMVLEALFVFGIIALLFFLGTYFFFLSVKKSFPWFEENFSIKKSHWSFSAFGLGVFLVIIVPVLPFFFVEFEETVNGSMATVLWGIQFWQSYLVIGLLTAGLVIRKSSINRNNCLFSGLTLIMTIFIVHMLLWPAVDTITPLWGVPVPIHSISLWTPFAIIPFLGNGCLLLGVTCSRTTDFRQLTNSEFLKAILPGISIGILGCLCFLIFWTSIISLFYLTWFLALNQPAF